MVSASAWRSAAVAERSTGVPLCTFRSCALPGVTNATNEDGHFLLTVTEPHLVIPALLARVQEAGLQLASLTTRNASLEDVFVKLTGRRLDEDETAEGSAEATEETPAAAEAEEKAPEA